MQSTNRRPSQIRVAFPLCHLGMLLLWAPWEAACRCSALWSHWQNVSALTSACGSLHWTCWEWGLNGAKHPQHPPLPCSVPPGCSHSASWGLLDAGKEIPNYKQLLQTPPKCWGVPDGAALRCAQQESVRRLGMWVLGRGALPAPGGRGALCALHSWMRLLVTTCPAEPLKQIMDDKARIQGKFSELMSEKQLTSLCAGWAHLGESHRGAISMIPHYATFKSKTS